MRKKRKPNTDGKKIDLCSHLSSDLVKNEIANRCDVKTLAHTSQVSKTWYGLFSQGDIWKKKLCADFDFYPAILQQLERDLIELTKVENCLINYKIIYGRFIRLKQKTKYMSEEMEKIFLNPDYQYYLLACCLDVKEFALTINKNIQDNIGIYLAILAGCVELPLEKITNSEKTTWKIFLDVAAFFGNQLLVEKIILSSKPDQTTLNQAAASGNVKLIEYLLESFPQFKPDGETLTASIISGNLALTHFLFKKNMVLKNFDSIYATESVDSDEKKQQKKTCDYFIDKGISYLQKNQLSFGKLCLYHARKISEENFYTTIYSRMLTDYNGWLEQEKYAWLANLSIIQETTLPDAQVYLVLLVQEKIIDNLTSEDAKNLLKNARISFAELGDEFNLWTVDSLLEKFDSLIKELEQPRQFKLG